MSNARNLANLLGTNTQITTADIADGVFQANRNLIINGAMQVAQRGTSTVTAPSSGYNLQDRWQQVEFHSGVYSIEYSTDVPLPEFKNSMKLQCTTADTSIGSTHLQYVRQPIEGQNAKRLGFGTSGAKSVTLSFWVKSSLTGSYAALLTNGEPSNDISYYYKMYTINTANTWEKKTITVPGPTSGTWASDNNAGLHAYFILANGSLFGGGTEGAWVNATSVKYGSNSGSNAQVNFVSSTNNNWYLTGVQLEVGDTATPFEHISYAEELSLCQRYFSVPITDVDHNGASNTVSSFGHGRGAGGGTIVVAQFIMPQPMRTSPTMTLGGSGGTVYVTDSNSRTSATPSSVQISQFCPGSTSALGYYAFGSAVCDDDRVCSIGAHTAVRITLDAEL